MKICFFETGLIEEQYIKKNLADITCQYTAEPLTEATSADYTDAEIVCIFIDSVLNKAVFNKLPKLKYIITRSSGFDHIDLSSAHERDIIVSYVPGFGAHTVAEFTFGLILALSRKIMQAHDQVKKLDFSRQNLTGFDLKDKTIGVVGVGAIGSHVIAIAHGFNMQVVAYDPHADKALESKLNFTYTSTLEQLLSIADIISLHAPYNQHTHHLLNKHNLSSIKQGALLINTARGALIETQALIDALGAGKIGGVGLDVLECEHEMQQKSAWGTSCPEHAPCACITAANLMLTQNYHALITPHIAFNSQEALTRILDIVQDNIRNYLRSKPVAYAI